MLSDVNGVAAESGARENHEMRACGEEEYGDERETRELARGGAALALTT